MSDRFGCCPICGQCGMHVNVEKNHVGFCEEHKVRWGIGSNLFSSWRGESEEIWKKNAKMLETFTEVEPIHPVGYLIGGGPVCQYCVHPHEEDQTPRHFKVDGNLYRSLPNPKPLCERCGKDFFGKESNRDDEFRLREHDVKLTNQQIVEFGHLAKEMIELCINANAKLFFEQANCYLACFYKVREMLRLIDSEYIASHQGPGKIMEFYQEGRELSNNWDRLHWIVPDEATVDESPF